MDRAVHGIPQVATQAQAGLVNAEATREKPVAAQRPRGLGDFALEHDAAQRLLGGIVGRRQPRVRRERPQRRSQLEDDGADVGHASAWLLPSAALERRPNSALQRVDLVVKQPAPVASAVHDQSQPGQPAPDPPGQPRPLSDPVEVVQQTYPTDLPAHCVDERVAGIAVRGDRCPHWSPKKSRVKYVHIYAR